ncbi:MAG: precorrin-6A reductase [Candidatus Methanomethylophilaceae archaeon]|nr:precorrin-6A reductase [Candidatus Methanomethylophilaceae archaeon]MBQ9689604.1 precorrin-6A reductase [Candidatus Methanomethylophilaceae archaeon]
MSGVFIFSGTMEGRTLSKQLADAGADVHVRVATEYGAEVMGYDDNIDVKVGSCGGAEGIANVIRENGYDIVVDATHPYALNITEHIKQACQATGAFYIRLKRSDSDTDSDRIVKVSTVQEAVDYLKDKEGNILASTGSKDIALYTQIPDYRERVTARVLSTMESVQKCAEYGFSGKNLICAQGPFSEDTNYATLKQIDAKYIVTKDSGTAGGYEDKVRAAMRAGATVVLIERPKEEGSSYEEVVSILEERLGLKMQKAADPRKRTVNVIGIGMGGDGLTLTAKQRIDSSDLVIGAKRMVESVAYGKDILEEYRSDEIIDHLRKNPQYRNVSVLMSGDIGFYSGAKKLLDKLDRDEFDVHTEPGISSAVYLCSKIGTSWQDVYMTSAHGREANLVGLSRIHPKVFTLLSEEDSVHEMAKRFIEYDMHVTITVGQDFGYDTESIFTGTPEEILSHGFGKLCVALICNDSPVTSNAISIPDEEFTRGDAPMTKSEVRALSVAKLKLSDDSVIYDIGAGTGSVSIEMALVAVNGKVYAIEKEDPAADLIEVNKLKFKTPNVQVIRGLAPEAMSDLPVPTHAFIGGSSGNLKDIVGCLLEKNPDIRIVINSVTIETLEETTQVIREFGLVEEEITCINVSKARKLGKYHLMTAQNPVYIAVVRGR